jgi:hypothetical protein
MLASNYFNLQINIKYSLDISKITIKKSTNWWPNLQNNLYKCNNMCQAKKTKKYVVIFLH